MRRLIQIVETISSKLGYGIRNRYHLLEPFIGTKAREMEWAARHNLAEGYWAGREHPVKHYLADVVFSLDFTPKTILEVGCASGPNLYLLAKKFPNTKISGVYLRHVATDRPRQN